MVRRLLTIGDELSELYQSRNILKSLIIKDLAGRYKNSILGFLWHFVTPVVMMVVYYVAFSQIGATNFSDFWIYLASAIFAFTFLVSNLTGGIGCIIGNSYLIKKMYFPREIVVISQVVSTFIIFLIAFALVMVADATVGRGVNEGWFFLPLVSVCMFFFTMGYVLFFSAIVVYVRDLQFLFSSLSLVFFFLTPVYFSPSSIDGIFRIIVYANPFTYFIECYHQIMYYGVCPDIASLMPIIVMAAVSPILGYIVFQRLKKGFVERL